MWDPVGEAALLTETETNSWRNLESVTGAQTENAKRNKVPSASSSQCVCVCARVCVCVCACVDCITVCLRLQVDSLAVMCSLPRPRIVCQVLAFQLGTKTARAEKDGDGSDPVTSRLLPPSLLTFTSIFLFF